MTRSSSKKTRCRLTAELDEAERAAVAAYTVDSKFFNAVIQGWSAELWDNPDFMTFCATAAAHAKALDGAVRKSQLEGDAVVFSGHGTGIGVRGALTGPPAHFIGLEYCYPGFISTSASREKAVESFVEAKAGSSPTLLKFRLPTAFSLLDMGNYGAQGAFEFLIGRNQRFRIVGAEHFDVTDVAERVQLILEPFSSINAGLSS